MSSSRYVGQLKQNNIQINSLRESNDRAEKHMLEHEQTLTEKTNLFMEYQQNELKKHTDDKSNPHLVTKEQVGLGNVLNNVQATKEEFDEHLNDTLNPHSVTKSQVGLANVLNEKQATKTEFDQHAQDTIIHITAAERTTWNAAESNSKKYTDAHSQNTNNPHKVTAIQVGLGNLTNDKQATKLEFDAHTKDNERHITNTERNKWNSAQLTKISGDDGQPLVSITSDFHSELLNSPTLTYFGYDKAALEAPPSNGRGFWTCSADKLYGQAIVLTNDNKTYRKSLINGAWSSWERLISSSEIDNVPWLSVTYKNGAKTGSRPLQYRKVAGTLQLSGHVVTNRDVVFASIPTEFSPTQGAVKSVEVSGTFGRSKLFVNSNGDLQLSGVSADNSAAITGYYIDVVVPLN
ncbi:hypothetical protein D3Z17_09215 [Bacillus subtilis]|uniref:hypothetical protein n=1 Tax=Bacillus subtilis TaxID=1423 RepID=UPI00077EB498|nr:hypothetical protein KHRBS_10215 [Bacillus subtilis subsp. subtilis]AYF11278.1 hypothetical protein D3Z17_09215 [Bacillus subtilis]QMV48787.1 hypothetical protein Goe11_c00340 [Bacillus phage vB_BsuS-Goe11]UIS26481.1 hypothetical protein Goe14_00340 [Bacillus phage vB_BsuS-Goe14]